MEQLSLIEDAGPTEVFLSLAEEYWQLICDGVKPYEYRRVYRRDRTRAFIVTTGPEAGVVGYLELDEPIVKPPSEIAALAESTRPGNGASVYSYLSDRRSGFAIPIEQVYVGRRVPIKELRREVGPVPVPQSYLVVARHPSLASFLHSWMGGCQELEI
jgi:predicted transcriptional regulator